MEPIDEWMQESMKHMDHAPAKKPKPVDHLRATPPYDEGAPWHPEEDRFQVPELHGDELTTAPHDGRGPVRLLTENDLASNRAPASEGPVELDPLMNPAVFKGTVEEEIALQTFLNMATAGERLGLTDNVVLPAHYARFPIEPIRFICENNLNFFQANIVKYILRWDAKNGMEDLQKAKRYLAMFIKFVAKDPDWWKAEAA